MCVFRYSLHVGLNYMYVYIKNVMVTAAVDEACDCLLTVSSATVHCGGSVWNGTTTESYAGETTSGLYPRIRRIPNF